MIILNKTVRSITWIVVIALIAGAFMLLGPRPFGCTPYVVASGSMEPEYPTGALLYVKKMDPFLITEGDTITFLMGNESTIATHRVVSINSSENTFQTKGDANDSVDGTPVPFASLIGVPQYTIPKVGYLFHAITSSPGKYILVAGVSAILLTSFLTDKLTKPDEKQDRPTDRKKKQKYRHISTLLDDPGD